jgi:hypothetical protein
VEAITTRTRLFTTCAISQGLKALRKNVQAISIDDLPAPRRHPAAHGATQRLRRARAGIAALLLAIMAAFPAVLSAAVFNVDTVADDATLTACSDTAPADCSLRGAIIRANALAEGSVINVPAGTYSLTTSRACTFHTHQFGDFSLNGPALCFAADITLIGAGASATIIDANQLDRVATVGDYTVELQGVKLQNGKTAPISSFLGVLQGGAGINNGGTLTLVDSVVSGNTAVGEGAGIFNGHSLTLVRTTVSGNTAAQNGGGIANMSYFEVTPLDVQDSTISGNRSVTGDGGGIYNFGGNATVSGSTISANQADIGGGVYNINNSAVLQMVNSTISGNSAASSGGGLDNHSGVRLVNVTVTNNLSATGNRGDGGGVSTVVPITIANTLIAGNRDSFGGAPDCRGTLFSQGYNLVQSTFGCALTGDATGNVVGQDPLLGVLADNGGPTATHALSQGSPAIDAGNPAAPGSTSAACAISDQRRLIRPIGTRCDIGAFERTGAFSLARVSPASGGNTGHVTVNVAGNGFLPAAVVVLRRAGQPDIAASSAQVDIGGSAIAADFDLTGRATGGWDVVVSNPGGASRTLAAAFTVAPGIGPRLWVDVIGLLRRHDVSFITVLYGNRGDVDALAVPLTIALPNGYQAATYFPIAAPPLQSGQIRPDWTAASILVAEPSSTSFLHLPLLLPVVPSGYSGVLRFGITMTPTSAPTSVLAAIGEPQFSTAPASAFVTAAANGAQAYLQQIFGLTIPAGALPELQQYASSELQQMVSNGRNALLTSIGTAPLVYSLGQYGLDVAFHAAQRAAGQ